ncbi:MAG: cytochrome c-type biogenesis protein CcmH [Acidimicrobiales bacterium]
MAAPGCGQGPEPGGCLMGALSVPTAPRMAGGERAKSGGFGWQGAVWGAIAVAVCAGVAFAAGVFGGGGAHPLSLYQRTMAVAGEYRCPVCAGESVAASDAPEAVEIKGLVQQWLAEGRSQAQIRSYLVKDYGTSILETPPTSGVSVLVWALPGAAVAAGLIGLGFGFARWRRAGLAPAGPVPAGPAPAGPAPDGLADPDAGEVAVAQQQVLFALEPAGAPAPSGRLGAAHRSSGARTRRSPRRLPGRVSLAAGLALVLLAGALWLVDRSATPRLPGDTITGGQDGTSAALQQASALATTDPAAALAVYDEVLAAQPDQPEALTDEGWIYAEGGFVDQAMARLDRAEEVDPSYDAAHFYRALVLLDEHRPGPAVAELKWYLGHGPASTLVAAARAALGQAEAKA